MAKVSVIEAASFAAWKHGTQTRKDKAKTPYICHPLQVAALVESVGCTENVVIAAVLHDVIEDCDCDENELALFAGNVVTQIVLEVSHNKALSKQERSARLLSDMRTVMTPSAFMVKMADRTQNLRDLSNMGDLPDGFDYEKVFKKADEGQTMLHILDSREDCKHQLSFKMMAFHLKRAVDQILDQRHE